jgi:hypothetical protein
MTLEEMIAAAQQREAERQREIERQAKEAAQAEWDRWMRSLNKAFPNLWPIIAYSAKHLQNNAGYYNVVSVTIRENTWKIVNHSKDNWEAINPDGRGKSLMSGNGNPEDQLLLAIEDYSKEPKEETYPF